MTAIFVSFWTVPPLPLWDQTTNSQTTKKKRKILFLILPQSGFSCLMLTMMTNYTNHTYNSNNDNNSITIILWMHFNPFRCTGSACSWVKMYMPGFTCGQQTNLKRWDWEDCWGRAEGLFFHGGGSSSVERGRQLRELYSTESSKRIRTRQRIKSFPHSVWQTITLFNVCNTTSHVSMLGRGSSETRCGPTVRLDFV